MLSSLNAVISTNDSTQIITGHVIYNPAYTYKFQLKTTNNFGKKSSFFHKLVTQDVPFPKQFDQVSYYHCIAAYKALINPFNVGLERGSRKAEIANF